MVQSIKCPTLAQVMTLWFVGSSPASGSVLTAQSPEPASDSVSPSLSLSLSLPYTAHNLSLPKINIKKNFLMTFWTAPLQILVKKKKITSNHIYILWGTWAAQSVKPPSSLQVMISQFVGSSPISGSVLTAQSLEPASHSVSPLFLLLPCLRSVSLSKISKH